MRISRRNFFLGTVGLAVLTATGLFVHGTISNRARTRASFTEKLLRYLLDGEIRFDDAIRQFSADIAEKRHFFTASFKGNVLRVLSRLPYGAYRSASIFIGGKRKESSLTHFEQSILTQFLLSTDYFSGDRPAAAPVRYTQLYDPYESACQNPLARFDA